MIVGVDPGMTGAFALVDGEGDLVAMMDMPTLDGKVNGALVMDILITFTEAYPVRTVVIEKVHAMPGNGSIGNFKLGMNAGIVQGVVMGAHISLVELSPSVWKRQMGVGSDKDSSRALAMQLWPKMRQSFERKKDHNRAEAALIARSYWQRGK